MKKINWFLLLVINLTVIKAQHIEVKRLPTFARAWNKVSIDKGKKQSLIDLSNQAKYLSQVSVENEKIDIDTIVTLENEEQLINFKVKNKKNKKNKIEISTNLFSKNNSILFRQIPLYNWYSSNLNINDLEFYGDPLAEIPLLNNKFIVELEPKEEAYFILKFNSIDKLPEKLNIQVKTCNWKRESKRITIPIEMLNKQLIEEEFPSILFNGVNATSSLQLYNTAEYIGIKYLQVNYIPRIIFDDRGNPINGIDHGHVNSKGFRDTAGPWLANGGKILLFWQPRYSILAPTYNGGYLKPFTNEWNRAFKNILIEISKYAKSIYPKFNNNQVTIYIVDEMSSKLKNKNYTHYSKLINYLKKEASQVKILATLGYYSGIEDLEILKNTDILVPHFKMKKEIKVKNKIFKPKETLDKVIEMKDKEKWAYLVGRGKTEDLSSFYLSPLQAVIQGFVGFSWYAFIQHVGSTWIDNDSGFLDYSLYYAHEKDNPIYLKYFTENNKDYLVLSMRLMAAKDGLTNAKILSYILENKNKLNFRNTKQLNEIINTIKSVNIDDNVEQKKINHISLQDIRNNIRRIYSELNKN